MPRHRRLTSDDMDEQQRALAQLIASGPRSAQRSSPLVRDDGSLRGPFGPFLLSPVVGEPLQALGVALRYGSSLPGGLREIAILAVAAECDCEIEWTAHAPIASREGVGADTIEEIRLGVAITHDEAAKTVCQVVSELLRTHRLTDATYESLVDLVGDSGAFELIALSGYYTLLAMVINGLDLHDDPQ